MNMSIRCCSSILGKLSSFQRIKKCYYSSQHVLNYNRQPSHGSTHFANRHFCSPASKGEVRIRNVFPFANEFQSNIP